MAPTSHFDSAQFVRELATLSLPALLLFMSRLDSPARAALRRFLPHDCNCPIRLPRCKRHYPQPCDCKVIPEPCIHVQQAQLQEWPDIPPQVLAYVIWGTSRHFRQPRLPSRPSHNTNPRAQVAIMAARHARKRHIRHPLDWIHLGLEGVDQRLTRKLGRLRNGADSPGPLTLEAEPEAPATEPIDA